MATTFDPFGDITLKSISVILEEVVPVMEMIGEPCSRLDAMNTPVSWKLPTLKVPIVSLLV